MDDRRQIQLRGIRITAQQIILDLAQGDYAAAKQHAELIRDGIGGMLPAEIDRDADMLEYLKKTQDAETVEVWQRISRPELKPSENPIPDDKLPAVLRVGKRKFKRTTHS